jgi:hypothetical protein
VAAALLIAVPAVAIAASTPVETAADAVFQEDVENLILTPVDEGVRLRVEPTDGGRRLRWTSGGPWRADVFYRVYRKDGGGSDVSCTQRDRSRAAYCVLLGKPIATTKSTEFLDPDHVRAATYRIGVGTNWLDDPAEGDVFAFSPPVAARG